MNYQANKKTATAQETAGNMLPSSGVDINPLAIPLRDSYRNSVKALMGYFDAHGIPYISRCEELGMCLIVQSDISRWQTSTRIRLGAWTGMAAVYTWMPHFLVESQDAWKAKRLVDAVNSHCEFAELGYNPAMQHIYVQSQVWFADADLRPRDVELAMRATGALLLRTLHEFFELSAYRKRIEASVEVLVRWLREEEMRAVIEVPEVEIEAVDEVAS